MLDLVMHALRAGLRGALAASVFAGCGGRAVVDLVGGSEPSAAASSSGAGGDGIEEPACPTALPVAGSKCYAPGQSCAYDDPAGCGGDAAATCSASGQWVVQAQGGGCPERCPPALPLAGTPCRGASTCTYTIEQPCGIVRASSTCEGGLWSTSIDRCPPPPPDPCMLHAQEDACIADAQCRWLNPGCADNPLSGPGCWAIADCAFMVPNACAEGLVCTLASADCPFCQTCSMDVLVCLPP